MLQLTAEQRIYNVERCNLSNRRSEVKREFTAKYQKNTMQPQDCRQDVPQMEDEWCHTMVYSISVIEYTMCHTQYEQAEYRP